VGAVMNKSQQEAKARQQALMEWKKTQPHPTIKDAAIDYFCNQADLQTILDEKTITTPDGCVEWIDATDAGYGAFTIKIRETTPTALVRVKAHRLTYALAYGFDALPPSRKSGNKAETIVLDHRCNNRSCVNPEHLQGITSRANILKSKATFTKLNLELVA
jgi:hypothetical protein